MHACQVYLNLEVKKVFLVSPNFENVFFKVIGNFNKTVPVFYQGFLLQWLNPKAWIACISGVSAFNLADSLPMLAIFVSLYFVICYASIASWALVGDKIKILLTKPEYLHIFNSVMGSALILVALNLLSLQFSTL